MGAFSSEKGKMHPFANFIPFTKVHFIKVKKYLPGADVKPLRAFKFSSGQNRTHKIV